MEIKNNNHLNELFSDARNEKPVMNLSDVEKVIRDKKILPVSKKGGSPVGINNLIVISGIIVSSFLAYMAMRDEKQSPPAIQQPAVIVSNEINTALNNSSTDEIKSDATETPASGSINDKPILKQKDLVRPAINAEKSIASTENVFTDEASDVSEYEAPTGEYNISFNYNDQAVEMTLLGDNVSELIVDGSAIDKSKYGEYEDLITEGKDYLSGNGTNVTSNSSVSLISFFDTQLRNDQLISREIKRYFFELNHQQLLINGVAQDSEVFKRYKKLYELRTDKRITKGSVYKYEKGAKAN